MSHHSTPSSPPPPSSSSDGCRRSRSRRHQRSAHHVFETAFVSSGLSSTEDLDEVDRIANHPLLQQAARLAAGTPEMGGSVDRGALSSAAAFMDRRTTAALHSASVTTSPVSWAGGGGGGGRMARSATLHSMAGPASSGTSPVDGRGGGGWGFFPRAALTRIMRLRKPQSCDNILERESQLADDYSPRSLRDGGGSKNTHRTKMTTSRSVSNILFHHFHHHHQAEEEGEDDDSSERCHDRLVTPPDFPRNQQAAVAAVGGAGEVVVSQQQQQLHNNSSTTASPSSTVLFKTCSRAHVGSQKRTDNIKDSSCGDSVSVRRDSNVKDSSENSPVIVAMTGQVSSDVAGGIRTDSGTFSANSPKLVSTQMLKTSSPRANTSIPRAECSTSSSPPVQVRPSPAYSSPNSRPVHLSSKNSPLYRRHQLADSPIYRHGQVTTDSPIVSPLRVATMVERTTFCPLPDRTNSPLSRPESRTTRSPRQITPPKPAASCVGGGWAVPRPTGLLLLPGAPLPTPPATAPAQKKVILLSSTGDSTVGGSERSSFRSRDFASSEMDICRLGGGSIRPGGGGHQVVAAAERALPSSSAESTPQKAAHQRYRLRPRRRLELQLKQKRYLRQAAHRKCPTKKYNKYTVIKRWLERMETGFP